MAIIAISGKINSGKDTVGSIIQYLQLKHTYPSVCGEWSFEKFLNYGYGEGQHTWKSNWEVKKIRI